jgi:hypothetical protein
MTRINRKDIGLIIVGLFSLFTLFGCGHGVKKKHDWLASESAPNYYPMKIISGYFHDPEGGSLYVPNKKLIYEGWGIGVSTHVVGPDLKALPNRLGITFFSYTEDQFYHGDFQLPYERILELFNSPYYSHKNEQVITYDEIVAGVAPGGLVTVWVVSADRTLEIFSGQAEKTKLDWSVITSEEIPRQQYINRSVEHSRRELSPEAKEAMAKNPVPLDRWKNYRKRYNWQLQFTGQEPPKMVDYIKYFNGERDLLLYPHAEEYLSQPHAVPKAMTMVWDWPKGRPRLMEFKFNEKEIMETFQELEKDNMPLYLEFRMQESEKGQLFSVLLKNEKREFYLKRTDLETYGVPERYR